MRLLLAGILAILPLTATTESLACMDIGESDSESAATRSDTEQYCNLPDPEDELGFWSNPYSPASPTIFLTLIGPYIYLREQRDLILHDPHFSGLFEMREGEAGKLDFTNDRYEAGVSTASDSWRLPAATPGWPPYTYGGRN
jgi:hypothetical protein